MVISLAVLIQYTSVTDRHWLIAGTALLVFTVDTVHHTGVPLSRISMRPAS